MTFVGVTTMTAAVMNIINIYVPQLSGKESFVPGLINLFLTGAIIIAVIVIFANAVPGWIKGFSQKNEE